MTVNNIIPQNSKFHHSKTDGFPAKTREIRPLKPSARFRFSLSLKLHVHRNIAGIAVPVGKLSVDLLHLLLA